MKNSKRFSNRIVVKEINSKYYNVFLKVYKMED